MVLFQLASTIRVYVQAPSIFVQLIVSGSVKLVFLATERAEFAIGLLMVCEKQTRLLLDESPVATRLLGNIFPIGQE